ncbi:MAG: GDSL-type esterase/lipase family protein [Phycisphaerae bacterium]
MPIRPQRILPLLLALFLLLPTTAPAATTAPSPAEWFSLDAKPLPASPNPPDPKGLVRKLDAPAFCITRSTEPNPQGTVLLFPGGAYKLLDIHNEGARTAENLNAFGYDVVMLEYHVASGPQTRDLALEDAATAWHLLTQPANPLHLHTHRLALMGYSAGGHLAARLMQTLPRDQQPDDAILVYPAYLDESANDAPRVAPPENPKPRLFAFMAANDKPNWLKGAHNYIDAWNAAGGNAIFIQFKSGGHGFGMNPNLSGDIAQWPACLNYLLQNAQKPGVGPFNTFLPWFLPNLHGRLKSFAEEKSHDQNSIVFLGDSITRKWNLHDAFPDLKTANRGISGDTTRGMLCRLDDTVLDLHPQAIILLGGINDFSQQPPGTPETIARNIRSILDRIHTTTPATPVFVCEILPSKSVPLDAIRAANTAVDEVLKNFPNARRIHTFTPFLNPDGSLNHSLFLDGTHPNPAGYTLFQSLLTPQLTQYTH